jgi:ABC-type sugar transport system permease subunit
LALFSIVALYLWKNTGWGILIYSAGLASVNETLYEEMEINGASLWDKVRMVTLPSLQGVIWVMLVISVINTLQVFTEVYIMTQGGPRHATEMMTTYIYKQAFFNMDLGYASALSVILLVLILGVTLLRLQRMHSNPEAV